MNEEEKTKKSENQIETKINNTNNQTKTLENYQLKTTLKFHSNSVCHLIILKDSRIASSSTDNSVKIFNKETYKIDINIVHKDFIVHIIQLKNNNLLSSCSDNFIRIFNIYENSYKIFQILFSHEKPVKKTIELNNDFLASCSWDKTIKIWNKNSKGYYFLNETIFKNNAVHSVYEISNDRIICVSGSLYATNNDKMICFYQNKKNQYKKIKSIENISIIGFQNNFLKINDRFVLFGGYEIINFIDIIDYCINNIYTKYYSNNLFHCFHLLNDNNFLVGTCSDLIHFQINDNNIDIISRKNNIHGGDEDGWEAISCINQNLNGEIFTVSYDGSIKVWSLFN